MPVIPSVEVAGNVATGPPLQIDRLVPKLNVGVVGGITFMVIVTG